MKATKDDIKMNQDLNKLIDMGFDVSQGINKACIGGVEFDLSAININKDAVFYYVIMKSYRNGIDDGQKTIKQNLKDLLN